MIQIRVLTIRKCRKRSRLRRTRNVFKSDTSERLTTVMALIASWAGFVQAFKIFHLQNALALSLLAVSIGVLNGVCWLLYGWARDIKPLVTSNVVGLVNGMLIIVGIVLY